MEDNKMYLGTDKTKMEKIITLIGIGGNGGGVVDMMINKNVDYINYIAINTDSQDLDANLAENKVRIYTEEGEKDNTGLGAGSNPEVGRQAAEYCLDKIIAAIPSETKMVFIVAGLGGGTGTGAAPVIAKKCKELGYLSVGFFNVGAKAEGIRHKNALIALDNIKPNLDAYIYVKSDDIYKKFPDVLMSNVLEKIYEMLYQGANAIAVMVMKKLDVVNSDFNDIKKILENSGNLIMISERAGGENRCEEVFKKIFSSHFLENVSIKGAKGCIYSAFTAPDKILTTAEYGYIQSYIFDQIGSDVAENIPAYAFRDDLAEDVELTLIVAGFNRDEKTKPAVVFDNTNKDKEPKPVKGGAQTVLNLTSDNLSQKEENSDNHQETQPDKNISKEQKRKSSLLDKFKR